MPSDLIHLDRDTESVVLSKAIGWHAERRVLMNEAKTVVFR